MLLKKNPLKKKVKKYLKILEKKNLTMNSENYKYWELLRYSGKLHLSFANPKNADQKLLVITSHY